MPFDKEKYRPLLKELNLSTADEDEMMDFLYRLNDNAISAAFARDATSQALLENHQISMEPSTAMVSSLCPVANAVFQHIKGHANL